MPDNQDFTLKIRVLDEQGKLRGGTVDVEYRHRTLSDHGRHRGLDASREINIAGLRRAPAGDYQITVTPTDVFKPQSQFVNIPASGFATVTVSIDRIAVPPDPHVPPYRVEGQVSRPDKTPVVDRLVQAFDVSMGTEEFLGKAITDAKGRFTLTYPGKPFEARGGADLIVRVFDNQNRVLAASAVIRKAKPLEQVNLIRSEEPPVEKPFVVRGTVREANGKLVPDVMVKAFDRDLRTEELLGEATAGAKGDYEIRYQPQQFLRTEKGTADLRVAAYDAARRELASSPIIFNAQPEETVDLVIGAEEEKGLSEYERYMKALAPVLGSIHLAELSDDDILFLNGETGINQAHLLFLVTAARFSEKTKTSTTTLPNEVFYGLFRENLPTELSTLLAQGEDILRAALKSALRDNLIPVRLTSQLEEIFAALKALRVQYMIQPPDDRKKTPLGALLDLSLPSHDKQITFVTLYTDHEGETAAFWQKLREHPMFEDGGQVEQLQFTLQLGALTGNHLPLVQTLRRDRGIASTPDLTKLGVDAWANLIKIVDAKAENIPTYIKGTTPEERVSHYAHHIVETLKSAFPNKYVQMGISQPQEIDPGLVKRVLALNPALDPSQPLPETINWGDMANTDQTKARQGLNLLRDEIAMFPQFDYRAALLSSDGGSKHLNNPIRQDMATFLNGVPEFDLGNIHIDSWLVETGNTFFQGIDESRKAAVTNQLKALQRVYQVVPRYEAMTSLLTAGLDSAQAVASLPADLFVEQFGQQVGGVLNARVIHESAIAMRDQTLIAYGNAAEIARGISPWVIGGGSPSIRSDASYADLFGRFDLCACEHCRSVYSPAAYLVDLLEFLNPKGGYWFRGTKPIDILHRRRPDLQHMLLTCENTNTKIPYIDLVNEVLESYVAFNNTLDPRITSDNTPVTSSELMANPQHVNAIAYERLKTANYPSPLPFNRDLEVVRTYLEHLGSSRYEVIATFQRDGTDSDAEVARECEYLKISPEERRAFTSGEARGLYGYSDARSDDDWQTSLAVVDEFLDRTDLKYADLEELLKTRFINRAAGLRAPGRIVIFAPNERCDPRERRLRHHDGSALNFEEWTRLQRFIRLWRKLGWPVLDVDKALTAFNVTWANQIAGPFLVKLGQAIRLQRELNLPLTDTLSFWSTIDTHFGDIATQRENSLYASLFQNRAMRALRNVTPSGPDPFELNDEGTQLVNESANLSDYLPEIMAAFRIGASELFAIRSATRLQDNPAAVPPTFASLKLENLSVLYRHVVLARALHLPIKDLITLMSLTGMDPFSEPGGPGEGRVFKPELTLQFLEKVKKVRQSGFSIAQLNYLYRHIAEPSGIIAPRAADIASRLTMIRSGLKKIGADADALGFEETLRRELAAVMDTTTIDAVMNLLAGTAMYTTSLSVLPAGVVFPSRAHQNISYNNERHQLRCVGPMTTRQRDALTALAPTAEEYKSAVSELFIQPRNLIDRQMGTFLKQPEAVNRLIEDSSATLESKHAYVLNQLSAYLSRSLVVQMLSDALGLESATTELLLTSVLKSRANRGEPLIRDFLTLRDGAMMANYFDSTDWSGAPVTRVDSTISFMDVEDWPEPALVRDSSSVRVKDRFRVRWTAKLLAQHDEIYNFYVRADGAVRLLLDDNVLLDHAAPHDPEVRAEIGLKAGQLYDLTLEYVHATGSPAVAELQWASMSTPKTIIPPSLMYTPSAFDAYTLLHKVALLINTFKLTAREVAHLSAHGSLFAGVDPVVSSINLPFDLNRIPLEFPDAWGLNGALFNQWERLHDLFSLRDGLPRGEVSLIDVFAEAGAQASPTTVSRSTLDKLEAATSWIAPSLKEVTGPDGFNLRDADLKTEIELARIEVCLRLSRKLGVSVKDLFAWSRNNPDATQAQQVKNAVKAKYEDAQWLTVAKGLNDGLREKQRTALVAHILTLPTIRAAGVREANQLFEYFLIDVEMSACMATSRIKQAISSVQLFVQRCFMNLEPAVRPAAISAAHWKWMKNYRVWEANRKVFLYPENWIEPELRDDKSAFFKELENELLQNEVTEETAEAAFLNYLEKLDEVKRLDIRGTYWEHESELSSIWEDPEWDQRPQNHEASPETLPDPEERSDILHVFGRTQATPPIYYYRKLLNHRTWTPWEKVQVDIEGDHLIPVVDNRRLYLFWPIFTETTDADQQPPQQGASDRPPAGRQPAKHLEIQIAWSEYKNGKWSAKKVSTEKISTDYAPAQYRSHFFFNAQPDNDALVITCKRWADIWEVIDGITVFRRFVPPGTQFPVDLRVLLNFFDVIVGITRPRTRNTQGFIEIGTFTLNGCDGQIASASINTELDFAARPLLPYLSHVEGELFRANDTVETLTLSNPGGPGMRILPAVRHPGPELRITNSFRILYPHQYSRYWLQSPFFYQDADRTYFVTPEQVANVVIQLVDPNQARPSSSVNAPSQASANLSRGLATMAPAAKEPTSPNLKQTDGPTWNALTVCPGDQSLDAFRPDRSPVDPQSSLKLRFSTFYHPHVCTFIKALKRKGIQGLLTLENQQRSDFTRDGTLSGSNRWTLFRERYDPGWIVDVNYPKEDVNFERGAYALYNWELFFHAPLLIAMHLSRNQRFDEAQQWFHYIFDPTDDSTDPVPKRFWKVLPFYLNDHVAQDQIAELLRLLSYRGNDPGTLARKAAVEEQIDQWKDDPFNPHLIARLRITAYQKTVVMKYIDNLIAWADQLFRQDTIESINEATQLYVLAYHMLGPRPEIIPPRDKVAPRSYATLRPDLDRFSNALVSAENAIASRRCTPLFPARNTGTPAGSSLGTTFYFCIPPNDKLLGYWDLVADRLFKVRHCLNIEGVMRQLPLFEPPIDPALLVRARAMGLDVGALLADTNVALPAYRFNLMVQKALELCAEVRTLGAALLSALEKRDAEELTRLRSGQEIRLLEAVREIRSRQIEEAASTLVGLQKSQELITVRRNHYRDIAQFSPWEITQLTLSGGALVAEGLQLIPIIAGGTAYYVPNFTVGVAGWAGSPVTTVQYGGSNVGSGLETFGKAMGVAAAMLGTAAGMAGTMGSFDRRWQDWKLQENLANKELEQVAKQIQAAEIRRDIATKELENHEKQIENARALDEYMRSKFTNRELYDWMSSQVSAIYFQTYQLAYDIAKRAEQAFRFERGLISSNFIQFGYWDSLRKGLLAGERLHLDLKRLEIAHLDQNKREYEITRNISLLMLDPLALIKLRETGECEFQLPEELFDSDYPGHFMRRIKSLSLTIPCVTGPYTNINSTLTLLSNKIRIKNNPADPYGETEEDDRFVTNFAAVQSIATSNAQNDSGLFELNFRDERYLPFEGAGAISRWRVEMPRECNRFDFNTISDVVLHVKYTARDGGETLKREASQAVIHATPRRGIRFFSARHEFGSEWHRFMNPAAESLEQRLAFTLSRDHFPFDAQGGTLSISRIELFLLIKDSSIYEQDDSSYARHDDLAIWVTPAAQDGDGATPVNWPLMRDSTFGGVPHAVLRFAAGRPVPVEMSFTARSENVSLIAGELRQPVRVGSTLPARLRADAIEDLVLVCHYS